jgi:predicted HicB family RNase H-like nuclease
MREERIVRDGRSRNRKKPQYGRLMNFRINPDLDERLWIAAEKENRSVSELIRHFCYQGLASLDANHQRAVNA